MRIDTDLHLFDVEFTQPSRFLFANQDCVGFQFYVEAKGAGVLDDLENIRTDKRFAAADREEENAGGCKLIERGKYLGGGHFAVAVVFEIAMFAALVTAIGNVEMNG